MQMNFGLLFAGIILVAVTYRCIVSIIFRRQFAENALLLKLLDANHCRLLHVSIDRFGLKIFIRILCEPKRL